MKTRIILLLLVCVCSTAFGQKAGELITSWGEISLTGNWKGGDFGGRGDHRSIPCIPVIASLENTIISLDFQEAAGDVTVTLRKEGEMPFSHSLLVDIPGKYCIPIDTYTSGVYLLELSNSYGGYIYGWFELK